MPDNPLSKTLKYACKRRVSLQVFLTDLYYFPVPVCVSMDSLSLKLLH